MVTPIDAVSFRVGWSEGAESRASSAFARIRDAEDPLNAARGMILGLVISGGVWLGLFVAGRSILRLLANV